MIQGRTILDVGCGVGLASLTAAAIKVREGSEQHFVCFSSPILSYLRRTEIEIALSSQDF